MPRRLARSVADRRSGPPEGTVSRYRASFPSRAGLGHRAQPSGQEPDAPGEILEVVAAEEGLLPSRRSRVSLGRNRTRQGDWAVRTAANSGASL